MSHPFDPARVADPFGSLAADYPGSDVYPPELFRVEWGPIFHRGRLDGSARVLVVDAGVDAVVEDVGFEGGPAQA